MTVVARLLVHRETRDGVRDPHQEHWGDQVFLALPAPGDLVRADHQGNLHRLRVLHVEHWPIPQPDRREPYPSMLREPEATVAAWHLEILH